MTNILCKATTQKSLMVDGQLPATGQWQVSTIQSGRISAAVSPRPPVHIGEQRMD